MLVSILFLSGVYGIHAYATDRGYSIELARTLAINTQVVMEIFHLFFIRKIYSTSLTSKAVRGTKVVWTVVVIITVAQFGMTYFPPMQAIFSTVAIPFWDGVLIIGTGVALFAIIEVERQIRLRLSVINRSTSTHGARSYLAASGPRIARPPGVCTLSFKLSADSSLFSTSGKPRKGAVSSSGSV